MVQLPDDYPLPLQRRSMSAAQRAFLEAAEAHGATAPANALALAELPRLSARALDELVELGVVREATDWRYYVFRSRAEIASGTRSTRRFVKMLFFWLIILLIPIVLIQFTGRH